MDWTRIGIVAAVLFWLGFGTWIGWGWLKKKSFRCPNCSEKLDASAKPEICPNCGKKLRW